ncbi:DtxR family iron (metal) dependent repressor [Ruminiclostridium sufflavum DSM 19573]|uniref:Manganese transport regulator n=1 Tax=Ruminiclostridium sufflavum DSM 19573 TaxID=1121337 RepID=A0A318XNX7_9FIRM|nr:metal-dependent transcriptional regulator [Ruminiclostridium sufflavum]PYG88725.1 DtxR family iron (metal) dependent repressor [Ruminiclostridium sufflavum DSM 19573]
MEKLTFTMENYLEAIYELSKAGKGVRVSDIAERLEVTKASTNSAMSTLAEKGLIIREKYGEIYLTSAGENWAEFTSKKHHIIRKFFMDILKIDHDTADNDACSIEHVISAKSIEAMQLFLQNYESNK